MGYVKKSGWQKEYLQANLQRWWEEFKAHHPRYEGGDEVVQKMLGCGEFENGYAVYICPECFGEKSDAPNRSRQVELSRLVITPLNGSASPSCSRHSDISDE